MTDNGWISVDDRLPPDYWEGLVLTDVRHDKPVMAITAGERYRKEFPYADYFLGRWREAILIGDHLRDKAKVTYWLEGLELPQPPENTND